MSETEPGPSKRSPVVVVLLVLLPFWLLVSTLGGLWLWKKGQDAPPEPAKYATSIEAETLAADLEKLSVWVGPRHTGSEAGRTGLTRTAAMIEGSLGPSNAGYRLESVPGPTVGDMSWPIVIAGLPGEAERKPLWVIAGYDQEPGGDGLERNATGVASLLAVASAVADESPGRPVYFGFLPHLYEPDAPVDGVMTNLARFWERHQQPGDVLVVEAMGGGDGLRVSSTDPDRLERPAFFEHAEATSAADAVPLARSLGEAVPVVRVATPETDSTGSDGTDVDPEEHAAATRALAELILDLAG